VTGEAFRKNGGSMQPRPPRYEIKRPVDYRVRLSKGAAAGAGRTVNISKTGLLFEPDEPIAIGAKIELTVHLGEVVGAAVTLRIDGVTLQTRQSAVAVAIRKYRLESNGGRRADSGPSEATAP
jgi:hypothetical protein